MSLKSKRPSRKPLHLIIDGPDKVGKTTVIELLSGKLDIPVIKMKDMPKHFKKDPEAASEVFNKTVAQFKEFSFILDRGYPSSLVYSYIYKRKKKNLEYLPPLVDEFKPKVVILYRTKPRIKDDIIDPKMHGKITRAYLSMGHELGWKLIDVGDLTPLEICKQILRSI